MDKSLALGVFLGLILGFMLTFLCTFKLFQDEAVEANVGEYYTDKQDEEIKFRFMRCKK